MLRAIYAIRENSYLVSMKHVTIIVPDADLILSSVVGPFKLFTQVNNLLVAKGQEPYYRVELVSVKPAEEVDVHGGLFSIRPNQTIKDHKKTDLIILPAFSSDPAITLEKNEELTKWLIDQYNNQHAEIAALCMGGFYLANTGLLDHKEATTHWHGTEPFKALFPKVKHKAERILTDEAGLYTSAGAYSFLNLLLHLVSKYNGKEIAIWISKMFEIDISRDTQSSFIIFSSQKDHKDLTIRNAQEYIEANYNRKLSVNELSSKFALSKRSFIRRFKKATNNTPLEYIQRVRVEAAKKLLEQNTPVTDVIPQVGYTDNKAFRTVFKKYSGLSPAVYRNKYSQIGTSKLTG